MLCAYGDCTNPGIALRVGKVSAPGIAGNATVDITAQAETLITQNVTTYSVGF